jgi:hypothetical protein
LSFELEAYTANQPAHYVVDADYDQRKGRIAGMNLWLTGQIESTRRMLTLLQTDMYHSGGMFPEFAFYDCIAAITRWTRSAGMRSAPARASSPARCDCRRRTWSSCKL